MCVICVLDVFCFLFFFFFFKQKTAYEMRISDWSSDVCSSDLLDPHRSYQARMPIGIRCRKGFDLRAAVRRHHNHRADYRDSIISEKRSGEDEPHGKVRAVEIFAMGRACLDAQIAGVRSEEHTSELQSLMRISYAVFCLKKKKATEH